MNAAQWHEGLLIGYAVALADATRDPAAHGLEELAPYIEFGASPRGPIGLVHAARALAMRARTSSERAGRSGTAPGAWTR